MQLEVKQDNCGITIKIFGLLKNSDFLFSRVYRRKGRRVRVQFQ